METVKDLLSSEVSYSEAVEGLGRILNRAVTPSEKSILKVAKQQTSATQLLTKGQKMLMLHANNLPVDEQKASKKITDQQIYFGRNLKGESNKNIIDANQNVGVGYASVNKDGEVQKGINMVIERLELNIASEAQGTDILDATKWGGILDYSQIAGLYNGEIELIINDKVVLKRLVRDFCEQKDGKATGTSAKDNGLNIHKFIPVKAGDKINARILTPKGQNIEDRVTATNEIFIQIVACGAGFRLD